MLVRGTDDEQARRLTITGVVVTACLVAAVLLVAMNPFAARPSDRIFVAIDVPYIGEGVRDGTAVVMHGVEIGRVVDVVSRSGRGVRLDTELMKASASGLTDTMSIDYRPVNYFGVTGINVVANAGGESLRDGMLISTTPRANATLQALLSRLGSVAAGAVTPKLVSVIDRAVRYTDALNPLVETMLIALDSVARVQTVSTARLLANATGVSVGFTPWVDSVGSAGDDFVRGGNFGALSDEDWENVTFATLDFGSTEIFGIAGRILTKYVDDLLPAIDSVKLLMDPVPALFRPAEFGQTLVDLRTRFEKMFGGTPEQRALNVRIVLDKIPGVAAPLGLMGASR
ncbi:Mammalian cell entry related domain protein [Mycolicibacterium pulveris]|uniref:Mce family protein n=1 Tax=Mycolicibacterium pulveris TaxID=36813 RepID=A0A7I7US55_MYCPV|nr:Mammalian cell entry related domain protein [Mycolicibacterium pulveris]MCV6983540.1 Mammalian cell entry related domain protein [Mycolicibacterium pulveris]BBY83419.1 hypothetical protein MPUL_45770 [Mycolicibacterium pulveris]